MHALLKGKLPEIIQTCRRYDVGRLSVFGSGVRDDFRPLESDFDFLVQFNRTDQPGYFDRYMGLADSLESLLGYPVDLVTTRSIRNPVFREAVQKEAVVIYPDECGSSQAS